MKKYVGILLLGIIFLCSCQKNERDRLAELGAERIVTAVEECDMKVINEIIFSDLGTSPDQQLVQGFGFPDDAEEEGILSILFRYVTVTVERIEEDAIVYKITAPDFTEFFTESFSVMESMDQSEILNFVAEFAASADKRSQTVEVSYKVEGERFKGNYNSKEFMDAITGGFLESYGELYRRMIEELKVYIEGDIEE